MEPPPADPESQHGASSPSSWYHKLWRSSKQHISFVGPGILASVAYFDPGNWATDLAAGSQFGYSLLFIVLAAGLGAILFQVLSCRLGIVTGKDLAQNLRELLHSRPKHRMLWRWGVLYPLYVLSELAIIATDLAELIGSAIALNLLFPQLPLYAGVLLTAADVLLVLLAYRPNGGARSMRLFEIIISLLVLAVFVSFVVLTFRVGPDWGQAFKGYIPSKKLVAPGALYAGIGIVGATVMPHALYLGSRLSTIPRLRASPKPSPSTLASARTSITAVDQNPDGGSDFVYHLRALKRLIFEEEDNSSSIGFAIDESFFGGVKKKVEFMRTHIRHASWDIVISLFGVAVTINSGILMVAAAAFYYRAGEIVGDLFDAHQLIKEYIGTGSAFLFAFSLLCAGQSASITVTLAGQTISEGFIEWTISPFLRRILTRLIGIVPSVAVSVAVGRSGLDGLIIASQVALSLILPFVIFPLVWITSQQSGIMRLRLPEEGQRPRAVNTEGEGVGRSERGIYMSRLAQSHIEEDPADDMLGSKRMNPSTLFTQGPQTLLSTVSGSPASPPPRYSLADETPQAHYEDFSSPWYVTALGYVLVVVMFAANMYVLVELGLGVGG